MSTAVWAELRSNFVFFVAAVLLSALAGLGLNAIRHPSLPLALPQPMLVELENALAASEAQNAVFIDAREAPIFQAGHIVGAINLPRSEGIEGVVTLESRLGKEQKLLIYCSEPECTDSLIVARRFLLRGFENVEVFKGGWEEWQAASLPTESAP